MVLLRSKSTPWITLIAGFGILTWSSFLGLFLMDWVTSARAVSLFEAMLLLIFVASFSLGRSGIVEKGNHALAWAALLILSVVSFAIQFRWRNDAFEFDSEFHLLWVGASLLPLWLWVAPILLNAYFGIFKRRGQPPLRMEYENRRHAPPLLKWLSLAALATSALVWLYLALEWFDPFYTYDDGLLNASAGPLMVSSTLLLAVGLAWIVQLIPYPDSGRSATLLMQAILAAIGSLVAFLALPSGWPGVLVVQATLLANAVLMAYMAGPIANVEIRFLPGRDRWRKA